MKKLVALVLSVFLITSCHNSDRFKVSGVVKSAEGYTLYIEHTGLVNTEILDSVKIKSDGSFAFKAPRPEYPDFYRLRLDGQTIIFAIDSCESIEIQSSANKFATDYTTSGSEANTDIEKLRKSVLNIQTKAGKITINTPADERNAQFAVIEKDINAHKELAKKIILKNPRSTAAYFAIYQKVNNTFLFSPYIKEDKPFYAAVATSYNVFMPEYERTKNLYNLVVDAINSERKKSVQNAWKNVMADAPGYIDITMNDSKGNPHTLSDLEGKVILLDFSAYEMEQSVEYTFALRELYNKYHSKGFEIYQVSLDRSKILWSNSTENIPWISVRDEDGANALSVKNYNVTSVPTTFLINRKGDITGKNIDFKSLDKEISKNL